MKRMPILVLLMVAAPLLLGMGGFTEVPPDKVPQTSRSFAATYIDQMDTITECTEASIDGKIFIEGKRGEGNLAVDFEKIKMINFRMKGGELTGQVLLSDGSETVLAVNKDKKAYGRAKYGAFQIKLSDLKKMIISPASGATPKTR
jgi:hypothetical protein